jgi:hypothetical protein
MGERLHMKQSAVLLLSCLALLMLHGRVNTAQAQQLEPRAYSPAPVGLNILGLAAYYNTGNVVTDSASPIQNIHARVDIAVPFYGRTFALFGRQASVTVATPVADAEVTGDVYTEGRSIDRTGIMDAQVRLAMNLFGGPALNREEFSRRVPESTLGASILVNVPVGQYDPVKLINLGTNRWACKPELGFSYPAGNWSVELYAGVWLFEANDEYFGGKVRRQDPLGSYQGHLVYEVRQHFWLALDYTYFSGGESTLNGVPQHDRQGNSRVGATVSLPVGQGQSVKMTWARGVSTRVGSDFDSLGAAWQLTWF